jgi:hypothetical protein
MQASVGEMSRVNASWENVHAYMANMGHFVLDTEGDLGSGTDGGASNKDIALVTPPFKAEVNALRDSLTKISPNQQFTPKVSLLGIDGSSTSVCC